MTAVVEVRTVTVPALSERERAICLAHLAKCVIESPEEWGDAVPVLVAAWAAETLDSEERAAAWDEYLDALRLEEGVETGIVSWQQVADSPGQDEALDQVRRAAAARLRVLVSGAV